MEARGKFEKSLRAFFESAEVQPDEKVWMGIELELEKAEGQKARKSLLWFKMLAAASLLFAAGIGFVYILAVPNRTIQPVADRQVPAVAPPSASPRASDGFRPVVPDGSIQQEGIDKGRRRTGRTPGYRIPPPSDQQLSSPGVTVDPSPEEGRHVAFNASTLNRSLPPLLTLKKPDLPMYRPDPGQVLLSRMADEERARQQQERRYQHERWWTSMGFGAGSFSPRSSVSTSASVQMVSPSMPADGFSYAAGMGVGFRPAGRLVLQGGLTYLQQQASFTSSTMMVEAAGAQVLLNEFADREHNIQATTPYTVSSSLQYVSVPIQAGIQLIDRSWGWVMSGGVATDIFVQNTLEPEDRGLNRTIIRPGDDAPYRGVVFSGLLTTELSYRVGERYKLAVVPGMRYALQSVYKSDVDYTLRPVTYDVSFRFLYVFK
jgi:hypothetical protein